MKCNSTGIGYRISGTGSVDGDYINKLTSKSTGRLGRLEFVCDDESHRRLLRTPPGYGPAKWVIVKPNQRTTMSSAELSFPDNYQTPEYESEVLGDWLQVGPPTDAGRSGQGNPWVKMRGDKKAESEMKVEGTLRLA